MIYIDTDIDGFDLAQALKGISGQRRQQALRFKHEAERRLCVMAYRLLQQALLEEYRIDTPPVFGYHEGGKPFIIGHEDIHFNMTHCRAGAACAVSRRPVGIDMETVRPFNDTLARYVLSEAEYRDVAGSRRPDEAFIRLWTRREAYGKLTGQGLAGCVRTGHDEQDLTDSHDPDGRPELYTLAFQPPFTGRLQFDDIRRADSQQPRLSSPSTQSIYLSVCQSAR